MRQGSATSAANDAASASLRREVIRVREDCRGIIDARFAASCVDIVCAAGAALWRSQLSSPMSYVHSRSHALWRILRALWALAALCAYRGVEWPAGVLHATTVDAA